VARGEEHAPEPPVVTGLRPDQQHAASSSYFAAFAWEPSEVDPESLTAAAFFVRVLEGDPSDAGDGAFWSADERYLDSVEIELVEESSLPPAVAAAK